MTDISRSRTGTASGPPPFVPLRDNHGKSNSRDNRPTSKQTNELSKTTNTRKLTQQNQQDPDKPTRTQMDKPAERLQRKPDRKPEASFTNKLPTKQEDATRRPRQDRGRQREDDDDEYQPSTRPTGDYQLADWFGKKLKLSDNKTSNWEDAITYDAMAEQLETSSLTTNHSHQHHYRNDAYSRRGNETQVREGTRYHRGRDRQERTDGFERAMRAPNERSHRSQQSEYPGTTNESTRPTGDYQLADWFGKKLKLSDNKTSNWEDAITYDAMAEQLETSSLTTNHSHQHHYRNDAYSRRGNETQVREGTRYHRGRDRQERTDGFERAMRAPNERSHRSQQSEYPGTTNERHGTHRDNRTHIHNARGNRTHNERGSRTHYDRGNKTHYDRGNRTHYDRDKGASYDRPKYHTTTTTAHTDDRGNRTHYDRGKEASYDKPKSHTITTTAHTNGKQQQTDKQYGGPDGDSRKPYLPQESSRQQEQCYQPKRKEEAPVVKEVWMQSSASSSDHWDWLGSTTTAVPFSAKRQN